jgi:nitrogen fixation NifU-like protein
MGKEQQLFDEVEGLMLDDARKIYSEQVIDHFLRPRNYGELPNPDCHTFMSGICGDTIGIFVGLDNGKICRISFITNGCGPTIACCSALTCMAEGLSIQDATNIKSKELIAYLGGLPVEHTHCADLAVNTLRGALEKLAK